MNHIIDRATVSAYAAAGNVRQAIRNIGHAAAHLAPLRGPLHPAETTTAGVDVLGYYAVCGERPAAGDIGRAQEHAVLAQTVYHGALQDNRQQYPAFPSGWTSMPLPLSCSTPMRLACPQLSQLSDGRHYDPASGLVLQIFENVATKQVTVAFGGTTAGPVKGDLPTRMRGNPRATAVQWGANLVSATGLSLSGTPVPGSYAVAATLTGLLKQSLDSQRPGFSLSLTGHSKGAAEAEYASLVHGVEAQCFGTPELSVALLKTLSGSQLAAGADNIRHWFVTGDLAPQVGAIVAPVLARSQGHVGSGFWMAPTPEVGAGPLQRLWCHDLFFASMLNLGKTGDAA